MSSLLQYLSRNANDTLNPQPSAHQSTSYRELLVSNSMFTTGLAVLAVLYAWTALRGEKYQVPGAITIGRRWWWEPDLWLCYRYTNNAKKFVTEGYQKYKDRVFVLKRNDVDYNILPHKYLDELRLVPALKLSSIRANVQNLGHKWSFITPMNTSNLHFRVVSNKLTPELPKYLDMMKSELDAIWMDEFPGISEEWVKVDIQEKLRRLAARMAAIVFVGHPGARDEAWINASVGFAMDVFMTGAIIRMFPSVLHPIVAQFIPARRRVKCHIKVGKRLLVPLIEDYQSKAARKAAGEDIEQSDILLNWMMEHGNEKETQLHEMSIRSLFITLAAVHTTSMTTAHMLFDLMAHPEWLAVMRDEIDQVTSELGPIRSQGDSNVVEWLKRLEKMDSFFVESQRLHVPTLFVPQRICTESMTLKDGLHIPRGTKITWAGDHWMNDASNVDDPAKFNPLRAYYKRRSSPSLWNKHLASSVNSNSLAFGYGNQACPGRFFSVGEVKLFLVRLLSDYDFEFLPGQSRPRTVYVGENAFPDPEAKVMMRKRADRM